MSLEISTVGAVVKHKIEATAGTRPTSGYSVLANVNTAPAVGANPSTIDASNITDGVTRYIPGRIDPGGIQSFTLNMLSDGSSLTDWEAIVTAYAGGGGKRIWIEYKFPNLSQSYYFPIVPLTIQSDNGISQNSLKTIEAPFVIDGEGVWAASST